MRSFSLRLGLVAALFLVTGCSAVIKAPDDIDDPLATFVLEHGRHSTLVLINEEGKPVRYAFGELDWYAHNNTGFFRGMSALLTPTAGTLGRRELPGTATVAGIRGSAGVGIEAVHCVAAPTDRVVRLARLLDRVFEENKDTRHYNAGMNLEFVEVSERFWFGNNSNRAVADWLDILDADVSGSTSLGNWRVVYPEGVMPDVCAEAVRNDE